MAREPIAGAIAQLVLLGLLSLVTPLGLMGWLAGAGYAVAMCATLLYALRKAGGSLGPADHVTLSRATLVGCVTALVAESLTTGHAPLAVLVTLASVALVMDAIDGQIARRTGTASPLGARFDMEVDAFLILVLSVHVADSLGPWVLVIGAMRYAFVAASWWLTWLRGSLPPSLARKTVAAVQGIVLVVAASDIFPRWFSVTVTALALASLVWSFARDVRTLHEQGILPA